MPLEKFPRHELSPQNVETSLHHMTRNDYGDIIKVAIEYLLNRIREKIRVRHYALHTKLFSN